jgi:electron transfer flavoprotein alpha subunit
MSGVLVWVEAGSVGDRSKIGQQRASFELIAAGRALAEQGAGALSVALIGADATAHAELIECAGVDELFVVPTPLAQFEAHVAQAALVELIAQRSPTVVLAEHTVDSLSFAPALAARGGYGFASDVLAASWRDGGLRAERGALAERLIAELDFSPSSTSPASKPSCYCCARARLPHRTATTETRVPMCALRGAPARA